LPEGYWNRITGDPDNPAEEQVGINMNMVDEPVT
jgi:hypothetical protein